MLAYSDTLIVNRHKQWAELFRTEVFPVSNRAELSYFRGFEVLNRDTLRNVLPPGAKIELRLEAIDAQSNQVLAALDRQIITRNIPPNLRRRKNILFQLGATKDIFLRVGLGLPVGLDIKQSMVEAYYESDEDSLSKHSSEDLVSAELTPKRFELKQNYPNPFNPTTPITLSLPEDVAVNLQIYDITGRKVRSLVNEQLPAGVHQIAWDGRNDDGAQVSSGVYIYRVQAGKFTQNRKMVLMR